MIAPQDAIRTALVVTPALLLLAYLSGASGVVPAQELGQLVIWRANPFLVRLVAPMLCVLFYWYVWKFAVWCVPWGSRFVGISEKLIAEILRWYYYCCRGWHFVWTQSEGCNFLG